MKLFAGMEEEYRRRHDALWPELAALLSSKGISDYSIFWDRRTNDLIGVLKVTHAALHTLLDGLGHDEADVREIVRGVLAKLPIIALTANAFPDDVKVCRDAGMNDFLSKPLRKPALVAAVLVWVYVWHTYPGYELRVVGRSERAAVYSGISPSRHIVLAMGKMGAYELNYSSDIDLIVVGTDEGGAAQHGGPVCGREARERSHQSFGVEHARVRRPERRHGLHVRFAARDERTVHDLEPARTIGRARGL